jgi:hypothetical protein
LVGRRGEPFVQRSSALFRERSIQLLALFRERSVQLRVLLRERSVQMLTLFSECFLRVPAGCAAAKILRS